MASRNRWHITRVKQASQLKAVFLSTDYVGVWTHYNGSRTIPCRQPTCEGCDNGWRREWHLYAPFWDHNNGAIGMLELTARAAEPVRDHVGQGKSLRGWQFRAYRIGAKINAPVEVELFTDVSEKYKLPDPPNIIECLLKTWRLSDDPTARTQAPKTTNVREHKRKKEPQNVGQEGVVQSLRPEHAGGLRSANNVHEPEVEKNGDLPTSSSFESSLD